MLSMVCLAHFEMSRYFSATRTATTTFVSSLQHSLVLCALILDMVVKDMVAYNKQH